MKSFFRSRLATTPMVLVTAGTLVFPAGGLAAPAPIPLVDAVLQSPSVVAARMRVSAAREMEAAAGLFPDPRIDGMAEQGSNGGGTRWPKWSARIEQPLPKAGERAAARLEAAATVSMAEAEAQIMAGSMAAEATMLLVEARASSAKALLLESQAARLDKTTTLLDSRSAAGAGRLEDKLAVQSQAAELRMMATSEAQMAADARLQVLALLGLAEGSGLPVPHAPTPGPDDWQASPWAQLAKAKETEADAMAAMATAGAKPMTALAVTASREEMPMETEDMVGIAFMMEIPWNARRSSRAGETAAIARAAAARAELAAAKHRFDSARARWTRAVEAAAATRRLADSTLGRLDAEYDNWLRKTAAIDGNGMGAPDILMLLEILEKRVTTEIAAIEADARADAAAATLWQHATFVLPPVSLTESSVASP